MTSTIQAGEHFYGGKEPDGIFETYPFLISTIPPSRCSISSMLSSHAPLWTSSLQQWLGSPTLTIQQYEGKEHLRGKGRCLLASDSPLVTTPLPVSGKGAQEVAADHVVRLFRMNMISRILFPFATVPRGGHAYRMVLLIHDMILEINDILHSDTYEGQGKRELSLHNRKHK